MKKLCLFLFLFLFITSSSSFSQFVIQNTPATSYLNSISSPSNSVAWASGDNQQLIRTTNGGTNWIQAFGDLPQQFNFTNIWAIDSLVANVITCSSSFTDGRIFRTSNGGLNWVQTYFQPGGFINSTAFINNNIGFAAGDPVGGRWTLLKTSNGGVSWDSTGLYFPETSGEVGLPGSLFYEGSKIWFGSQSGKMYISSNSGSNWTNVQTVLNGVSLIFFNDASQGRGFSGSQFFGGIKLAKSTNGSIWLNGNSPTAEDVFGICGEKNSSKYWIALDTTIYFTPNEGTNWYRIYHLTSGAFFNMTVSRSGSLPYNIYASLNGGRVLAGNTNTVAINQISTSIPEKFKLFQNYPNPFNPTTTISFNIKEGSFVTLSVFDITGKEVQSLINENLKVGSYNIDFNSANFPSGVYYYKIIVGTFFETKKMILVK